MALISTNHRMLYVIGSSGGSFTGVITNETLTGNGTSAFPLGINESALAPSEAEIYVQTNSGGLNEVSSVVQSNSANWNSITGMSGAYVPLSATDCAIGSNNYAGYYSFAQGIDNSAAYNASIAQGLANTAYEYSLAQGNGNYANTVSLAQGNGCRAVSYSMAQGQNVSAKGPGAFAQGFIVEADGAAFAQGQNVSAIGYGSFSQGYQSYASQNSLAQGTSNTANGGLAQGYGNLAYDGAAIGYGNTAKNNSFTLGVRNSAFETSIAQGLENIAQYKSFAQGVHNSAYEGGLAQGNDNYASAASIAVGDRTSAEHYSQAFGVGTTADNNGMAIGAFNKTTSASFVIGNGTANDARSDLFVIYPDGSVSAQGKISANGVELGVGGGGTIDDEVVNYVVSNSANIQATNASAVNVYNTVNTNSASWAAGASTPLSSLMEYGENVNFTALSSQIAQGIYPSIRFKLLNWVNNIAYYFCYEAKLNPVYNVSDPYGKQIDYITWIANIYARPDNAHFNSDTSSSPRFMTFRFGYDPYFREWTSAGYSAFSNM